MTALAFSEQYLFSGQGPFLKVRRREDGRLLEIHKILSGQAIHGLVVSASTIIIWGGHFISVHRFLPPGGSSIFQSTPVVTFEAPDWILDVSISPYHSLEPNQSHLYAAVLTAHNALLLLDFGSKPSLRHLTSTSRCMLYSANLCWQDSNHVFVASGTVFGEIILWSCLIEDRSSPKSILHQLLSGHDGSIFGVRIFELPINGTAKRSSPLLVSCSDDRTIRVWDISGLPEVSLNPQATADMSSARETGFGANVADFLPEQATTDRCIAKAWGHA